MKALMVTSSLFSENGQSSSLAQHFEKQWKIKHSEGELLLRDLGKNPVPHLDAGTFQAATTAAAERSTQQQQQAELADTLIEELQSSDLLVLGVPMYNFGIPSTLKAWIDHVARAGTTFRYTSNGPEGLLKGKTAYILAARGGVYQGTDKDTQTPYLKTILNFLGIEDIHFVYAEALASGSESAEEIMERAKQQIDVLIENAD